MKLLLLLLLLTNFLRTIALESNVGEHPLLTQRLTSAAQSLSGQIRSTISRLASKITIEKDDLDNTVQSAYDILNIELVQLRQMFTSIDPDSGNNLQNCIEEAEGLLVDIDLQLQFAKCKSHYDMAHLHHELAQIAKESIELLKETDLCGSRPKVLPDVEACIKLLFRQIQQRAAYLERDISNDINKWKTRATECSDTSFKELGKTINLAAQSFKRCYSTVLGESSEI